MFNLSSSSCVLAIVFHPINDNEVNIDNIDSDITSNYNDDFAVIFDHLGIKILTGILCLYCLIFNNAYYAFMIVKDKDHGDPTKRSVVDVISPYEPYAVILHNLICVPLWTWRILMGPLSLVLAEFEGFIQCIFLSTIFLISTEVSLIKAFMKINWSLMAGINDLFLGKIICVANMGLIFGIQVTVL